jgi:hypothetical protein
MLRGGRNRNVMKSGAMEQRKLDHGSRRLAVVSRRFGAISRIFGENACFENTGSFDSVRTTPFLDACL